MTLPQHETRTVLLEQLLDTAVSPADAAAQPSLARGVLIAIHENGELEVTAPPDGAPPIRCDLLESGTTSPLDLKVGDQVLVMLPLGAGQKGCVLGRVGRYQAPRPAPDQVIIEAGELLTLKCGESSIDLRKDGKLMIRGNDVLARAKRTHRIKGGTVAIN